MTAPFSLFLAHQIAEKLSNYETPHCSVAAFQTNKTLYLSVEMSQLQCFPNWMAALTVRGASSASRLGSHSPWELQTLWYSNAGPEAAESIFHCYPRNFSHLNDTIPPMNAWICCVPPFLSNFEAAVDTGAIGAGTHLIGLEDTLTSVLLQASFRQGSGCPCCIVPCGSTQTWPDWKLAWVCKDQNFRLNSAQGCISMRCSLGNLTSGQCFFKVKPVKKISSHHTNLSRDVLSQVNILSFWLCSHPRIFSLRLKIPSRASGTLHPDTGLMLHEPNWDWAWTSCESGADRADVLAGSCVLPPSINAGGPWHNSTGREAGRLTRTTQTFDFD